MNYIVKDISLAEFGRKELDIAETEMPYCLTSLRVLRAGVGALRFAAPGRVTQVWQRDGFRA